MKEGSTERSCREPEWEGLSRGRSGGWPLQTALHVGQASDGMGLGRWLPVSHNLLASSRPLLSARDNPSGRATESI